MAHLWELCIPAWAIKLKYLCLAQRKHPDQVHLWMASGKRKLTQPLWSLARTRKYLQQLTSAFFTFFTFLLCFTFYFFAFFYFFTFFTSLYFLLFYFFYFASSPPFSLFCERNQYLNPGQMVLQDAAAAAAKSLQSCPTLCDPIDGSPPGSPIPGILQAKILEWVAISFSNAWNWKVKWSHSVVSDSSGPHGLQPTRLFCPLDSPGKSAGVGCHCLLLQDTSLPYSWSVGFLNKVAIPCSNNLSLNLLACCVWQTLWT